MSRYALDIHIVRRGKVAGVLSWPTSADEFKSGLRELYNQDRLGKWRIINKCSSITVPPQNFSPDVESVLYSDFIGVPVDTIFVEVGAFTRSGRVRSAVNNYLVKYFSERRARK